MWSSGRCASEMGKWGKLEGKNAMCEGGRKIASYTIENMIIETFLR